MTQLLTGVEFLGCIYDIYGYYARANSVRTEKRLFSLPEADTEIEIYNTGSGEGTYNYPSSAVSVNRFYKAGETTTTSETAADIYSSFTVSADMSEKEGLFSAEVSAKYSESHTNSSYFYHVEQSGYVYSYRLTVDLDYMKANLDSDFKLALVNVTDSDSAEQFVKTYGTHFLYEAVFGGRWSYSQSVSKFTHSSSSEAKMTVKGNYGNYSGSISASNETDSSESNTQSKAEFWCIGGNPGALATTTDTSTETITSTTTDTSTETTTETTTTPADTATAFNNWINSVPGNYALMDFTTESLKRISELIDNSEIAALEDSLTNDSSTVSTDNSETDALEDSRTNDSSTVSTDNSETNYSSTVLIDNSEIAALDDSQTDDSSTVLDRQTLVDEAIAKVLDEGKNPPMTSLTYKSYETWEENAATTKIVKIGGAKTKQTTTNIEQEMKPQDGYVVVGFGGNVNNKADFNRIAVCLLDLSTGQREWRAQEDGNEITFNQTDYETIGEVPDGCVLTGIGISGGEKKFRWMVLHYQELAPTTPTTYLDNQVSSKAFKFQQELDEPKDSYDVEFKPDGNEGKVIVGIGVAYIGGDTDAIILHRAALEEVKVEE